ncbi:MAG: hypothetical protein AAGD00_03865 [Planctomycetota bacterium]
MSEEPAISQAANASSRCLICRYDRARLDDATPCPECGNSAIDARALWASRLRTSAWVTLIACLAMPATWFVPRLTQSGWGKMAIALLPILALIAAALALRGKARRAAILFALASLTHVSGWIQVNSGIGIAGMSWETAMRIGLVVLYASITLTLLGVLRLVRSLVSVHGMTLFPSASVPAWHHWLGRIEAPVAAMVILHAVVMSVWMPHGIAGDTITVAVKLVGIALTIWSSASLVRDDLRSLARVAWVRVRWMVATRTRVSALIALPALLSLFALSVDLLPVLEIDFFSEDVLIATGASLTLGVSACVTRRNRHTAVLLFLLTPVVWPASLFGGVAFQYYGVEIGLELLVVGIFVAIGTFALGLSSLSLCWLKNLPEDQTKAVWARVLRRCHTPIVIVVIACEVIAAASILFELPASFDAAELVVGVLFISSCLLTLTLATWAAFSILLTHPRDRT